MAEQHDLKVSLGGTEYVFRLTIPRLREINLRTGKGYMTLYREAAVDMHFDSLGWLLWAGLAHPENDSLKAAPMEKILGMIDFTDVRPLLLTISQAFEGQFARNGVGQNPPAPLQ